VEDSPNSLLKRAEDSERLLSEREDSEEERPLSEEPHNLANTLEDSLERPLSEPKRRLKRPEDSERLDSELSEQARKAAAEDSLEPVMEA